MAYSAKFDVSFSNLIFTSSFFCAESFSQSAFGEGEGDLPRGEDGRAPWAGREEEGPEF